MPIKDRMTVAVSILQETRPQQYVNRQGDLKPLTSKMKEPQVLESFDTIRLHILLEFLYDFSAEFIFKKNARSKLLSELGSSSLGSDQEKVRTQIIHQL